MRKNKANCVPASLSCASCEIQTESLLCTSPEALELMEKVRTSRFFKAGQTIFSSGNDASGVFTVRKGLVKLEAVSYQGGAHTLRLVGPGGALGYRSLFANEPYHASAIAVEDSELCFIPKTHIMSLLTTNPDLAMSLLTHVAKDLRHAERKWLDQMDKGAFERVAEALLFLQEHFSQQQWTRREIAQWAGTTPETVIRTLAQFEKEGLIDQSNGRNIQILNKHRLRECVHPTN